MAFDFRSISSADPVAQQKIKDNRALSDQLITIGAASLALVVVAAIAILIGIA